MILTLEEQDIEALSVAFSGYDGIASPIEVAGGAFDGFFVHVMQVAAMRESFAISGAMRWPESQEAPIHTSMAVRSL